MSAENDSLLRSGFLPDNLSVHKASIDSILKQYGANAEKGLTSNEAKAKRNSGGLNIIPPPLSAPAWLCCLLPCLLKTKSMMEYNECVPEHVMVKRNNCWIKIDITSIVPGDIIMVSSGNRLGADIRIISSKDCQFNTSTLTGDKKITKVDPKASGSDIFLQSPNMGFTGYLCTNGECEGVVIATGDDTVIAKMIRKKEWPINKE